MAKQRKRYAIMAVIETDDPTLVHMTDDTDRNRCRIAIQRALADNPLVIAIMTVELAQQVMAVHDIAVAHMTGEKPAKLKDHN